MDYHQQKFGYEKPNVTFVQGYMEKLNEGGIQMDSMDVLMYVRIIALIPLLSGKKCVTKTEVSSLIIDPTV